MLIDSKNRIIAASDGQGVLSEQMKLEVKDPKRGSYLLADGALVAYALTPGYETYQGLGWRGVIVQQSRNRSKAADKPAPKLAVAS